MEAKAFPIKEDHKYREIAQILTGPGSTEYQLGILKRIAYRKGFPKVRR